MARSAVSGSSSGLSPGSSSGLSPGPSSGPPSGRPPVFIADRASMQRDVVVLSGDEGRHAATVRRLRPGERVDLIDGAGMTAECVVAAARPGRLELTVLGRHEEPPPQPRICVVQAIPKGDRGEQAVETMTEVGVDVIVPWAAERCVAVWGPAAGPAARPAVGPGAGPAAGPATGPAAGPGAGPGAGPAAAVPGRGARSAGWPGGGPPPARRPSSPAAPASPR